MRFEYYHAGLEDVPKLSVDGLVPHSLHFSHWQGNRTPARVKADSSTEIALNVVAAPDTHELTQGLELITNNHFDTDGVLSVWTLLTGARALDLRAELIAAAEAGDFSAHTGAQAIRASLVIQGGDGFAPDAGVVSPLARHLAGDADVDEAQAYALVLPEVERIVTSTNHYEHLWHDEWAKIEASLESFARGASQVEEDEEAQLSIITLSCELYGARGFSPTRHAAPYTAITHHARGQLYLIAIPLEDGTTGYRIDYPYHSWAETVVRPAIRRYDFAPLVAQLNEWERNREGRWQLDTDGLSSAFNFVDDRGLLRASCLAPEKIADALREFVRRQ
ncbi:MAG: DUF6687 family protein [Pyrinomonadaceae bacterium]